MNTSTVCIDYEEAAQLVEELTKFLLDSSKKSELLDELPELILNFEKSAESNKAIDEHFDSLSKKLDNSSEYLDCDTVIDSLLPDNLMNMEEEDEHLLESLNRDAEDEDSEDDNTDLFFDEVGNKSLHDKSSKNISHVKKNSNNTIKFDKSQCVSKLEKLKNDLILQEFKNEINKINDQVNNVKTSKRYENLMKLISENNLKNDDEEIITVAQNINNIDPITKLPIVKGVKNKICGHIYEKSSITQLIARNPKTKCPIAGCVAADYVHLDDLISI